LTKPGLILAQVCSKAIEAYTARYGEAPKLVFLKNHGIFIAADSVKEIDALMEFVMDKLYACVTTAPDFADAPFDKSLACSIAPALRMLFSGGGKAAGVFCTNKQVMEFVSDAVAFKNLVKPFTPDHIVYCKDEPIFIEPGADLSLEFEYYVKRKGYAPKIVAVRGLGFFSFSETRKDAERACLLFLDAMKISVYAGAFGGIDPLPDDFTDFILNWEAEAYRSKSASLTNMGGRLCGKIAVVTGGAQGFGKGIAESMASHGAYIAVADLNLEGAAVCAAELNEKFGVHTAVAVAVDVSDEDSVKRMIQEAVLEFGGLDVLVSNAGVLIAGGLSELSKQSFDLVTNVNYTGYFLCAKYAAEPMKIQREYAPEYMMDIIEINSKSGLEGSNKNFAYAGSKFGGIGLTQSFAMELVEYGVKVNAICPGNLLDGPLWSDPERGLFKQYLDSGKVAGAKTVEDVRKFYEAKVPIGRGCTVADVACAILYVIEQKYETGQAVPVTGGQVMLK
jgi:NAD(P)-dependent dehydrogenase (short-subunit alcohol dehydrogenase family)